MQARTKHEKQKQKFLEAVARYTFLLTIPEEELTGEDRLFISNWEFFILWNPLKSTANNKNSGN